MINSFVKDSLKDLKEIFILIMGNGLPQVVYLLTLPILSRLFNVEVFGLFAAFSAILVFAQPVSMLTLENALLITKGKK